jgi:DNA processing protein
MQATFVTPFDKDMPPALIGIPDTPGLLRVRGDIASNCAVAIVGTRRCSDEGERAAHFFARELARCGVTIVSGGARGIDAAAHRGALEAGGHTIVVLGCGLCQPYPPEHAGLYGDIVAAGGGLISEHHIDRRPRPSFFPRRNRLISGLSIGVLVVEAPRRSGAMLTARLAVDAHGRDCWAMLADGTRQSARGGLEAIRDGWAKPVLDPVDILGDLPCGAGVSVDSVDEPDGADTLPDRDDLRVLAVLVRKGQDVPVEVIVKHAQRPLATVLVALTRLQLLGAVMQERGCWRTTAAGVAWLGESVRAT